MTTDLMIGIASMAVLFVAAGLLGMEMWRGCGGHCESCSNDCEIDTEGRRP